MKKFKVGDRPDEGETVTTEARCCRRTGTWFNNMYADALLIYYLIMAIGAKPKPERRQEVRS